MKKVVHERYGSPRQIRIAEAEKPAPKENQVLIRVHAAAINPLDWHYLRGSPFPIRLEAGLFKPRNTALGVDVAGVIEAVGSAVTDFTPGDEVFGSTPLGALAEYTVAAENRIVPKPANVSFVEAAASPVVGYTALQGLRDYGKISPGKKVLINGASGGVGTFAVQVAKWFGADVTGVTSTRNVELVRSLGAYQVIDYTKEDFTRSGQQFDLILDNVANHPVAGLERALSPGGIAVIVGFSNVAHLVQVMLLGPRAGKAQGKKIGSMGLARPNKEDLQLIAELLETGKVRSVIDTVYPLSEAAAAMAHLETGHARGKIVLVPEIEPQRHEDTKNFDK